MKPAQIASDFERSVTPSPAPQTTPAPIAPPESPGFAPAPASAVSLVPERHLLLWPWLLAAAALAGAAAFLFLRSRGQRHAVAGAPEIDLFAAPEPAPAPPRPAPPPRAPEPAPPAATPRGIVSSLRPWIEVKVQPLRCILTEENVTVEFELELLNSGNAPARGIHVAAALINAGDGQDRELVEFFSQASGPGERIEVIQPLKSMNFATQIVVANDHVRALDVGGRRVFVPLLAFSARYAWGSKEGQTSVTYMVGRDGKGEKLAPFRLDLGPRIFRGLAARLLPAGVRS